MTTPLIPDNIVAPLRAVVTALSGLADAIESALGTHDAPVVPIPGPAPLPAPLTDGPATLPVVVQIVASYTESKNPVRTSDVGEAQAALDAGRDVLIPPGATMLGRLTFPKASVGNTVRTDRPCPVPPGVRVNPKSLAGAARILAPDAQGAITIEPGAQRSTICDLDIQPEPSLTMGYWLVNQRAGTADEPESMGFLVDRVLVQGALDLNARPTALFRRGIALNSGSANVLECYVGGFHTDASDSQAIAGWAGSGNVLIRNPFLSAGSEVFAFGGGGPSRKGRFPRNIRVVNAHMWKGITGVWEIGGPLYVPNNKVMWEVKAGAEVEVAYSVFENQAVGGNNQRFPAVLKGAPYEDEMQAAFNITGHHCVYLNCGGGYGLHAREVYPSQNIVRPELVGSLHNVSFHDDVWLGRPRNAGSGIMLGLSAPTVPEGLLENVDISHITAVAGNSASGSASLIAADANGDMRNVVLRDSILPNERYGVLTARSFLADGRLRVLSNLIHDDPSAYGPGIDRTPFPQFYDSSNVGVDNLAIDAMGRISDADASRVRTTDGKRVGADLDVDALLRAVRSTM